MSRRKFTRRQILKAASILAAFLASPKILSSTANAGIERAFASLPFQPNERRTIAIVGSGVAGLSAAYSAANAGFRVVVYEATDRYGGRSLTVRPQDDSYREWWFRNYNPQKLFPEMYVSSYQERPDSPVREPQVGNFNLSYWPDTNEFVELFLNAGPGRIPSNHKTVLDLCGEIGVRLEPYVFLSGSNKLSSPAFRNGQPVQWREINYSLMGELAELLHASIQEGMILSGEDPLVIERFRAMVDQFGDLNAAGAFEGSATVGYSREPGGWLEPWGTNTALRLEEILGSGFIGSGDPEQSAGSFVFNPNHIYWQPTLMQPVGGMDRIWQQILLQEVPGQAIEYGVSGISTPDRTARGGDPNRLYVGDLVRLNTPVTSIANVDDGVEIVAGGEMVMADYAIVTVAPVLMSDQNYAPTGITPEVVGRNTNVLDRDHDYSRMEFPADMLISSNLSADFKKALGQVNMTPAIKVGAQGKTRFWEREDQIYGGISWTTEISSQIWYPSEDFNAPTGILTAAYNRGLEGYVFALKDQDSRITAAIRGGETLHDGFAEKIYSKFTPTIAWQFMPGQVAGWVAETYKTQCQVYTQVVSLPQGNIFFAGDSYSQTPGWQEGALSSARMAVFAILNGLTSADPSLYSDRAPMEC